MTTHDNAPPPPDWTPCVGNLCAGCNLAANTCRCLTAVDHKPCCGSCSHSTPALMPLRWDGDDS